MPGERVNGIRIEGDTMPNEVASDVPSMSDCCMQETETDSARGETRMEMSRTSHTSNSEYVRCYPDETMRLCNARASERRPRTCIERCTFRSDKALCTFASLRRSGTGVMATFWSTRRLRDRD
jgi:hypothetical protein